MDSFLEEDAEVVVVDGKRRKRRRNPAAQSAMHPSLHLPFLPPQPGKGGAFVRPLREGLPAVLGVVLASLRQIVC